MLKLGKGIIAGIAISTSLMCPPAFSYELDANNLHIQASELTNTSNGGGGLIGSNQMGNIEAIIYDNLTLKNYVDYGKNSQFINNNTSEMLIASRNEAEMMNIVKEVKTYINPEEEWADSFTLEESIEHGIEFNVVVDMPSYKPRSIKTQLKTLRKVGPRVIEPDLLYE